MAEGVSMKKAVAYTAIAKYTTAVLQIFFAAILSRILTPEEYGTVAVITVFVVFFQLFCDMGFGTAVIQDKGLTAKQINDIFSWTVYLGLLLQILFIGASYPIASFYEDSIYIPLGIILSITLLLNALNMIPNAVLLKEKRFKLITIRTIVIHVVTSIIAIILAWEGFGVYALVLQAVFSSLFIFVWNEISVKLKFNYHPDFLVIKRIWGYSIYQFLAQLINFFNRNLDNLLIGKFFSKAELGQYNKSYHLMQMPISFMPGVIGPALHPILSEHQDDHKYIYNAYLRVLKMLSLLGCIISVLLYYTGDELVILLFGDQWYPAIMPFKILAISVWFQLATNTFGPIYLSIGNTKLMFHSVLYSSIIILTSIIIGCALGGIVNVAICITIAYIINYFISFTIMVRYAFHESLKSFFFSFKYETFFFIVLMALTYIPITIENLFLSFCTKALIMVATYALLLFVTGQYKLLLSMIRRK